MMMPELKRDKNQWETFSDKVSVHDVLLLCIQFCDFVVTLLLKSKGKLQSRLSSKALRIIIELHKKIERQKLPRYMHHALSTYFFPASFFLHEMSKEKRVSNKENL